jgi:hypothetical protein
MSKEKKIDTRKPDEENGIDAAQGSVSSISAHIERTVQVEKYGTKGGTGFAAEDGNARNDTLRGKTVETTGRSNVKNGPDRIADGVAIQTKYYSSGRKSINAAFDKNTGMFRYEGQKIEVPKDQYQEALKAMRDKISEGKIPGETNPDNAAKYVKEGSITYQQAKNIAKAGNIDSITFDAKNQAIGCLSAVGISVALSLANALWNNRNLMNSAKETTETALKTSGKSLATNVAGSQFLRTELAKPVYNLSKDITKAIYKTDLGKNVIKYITQAKGNQAITRFAKLVKNNGVFAAITIVVSMSPDFYRAAFDKSISWAQFAKNGAIISSGIVAGIGGGALAVVLAGLTNPATAAAEVAAFMVAMTGGMISGAGASAGVKNLLDKLKKDDAAEMYILLQAVIEKLSSDYMLTDDEVFYLSQEITCLVTPNFLRKAYASGPDNAQRYNFFYQFFEKFCIRYAQNREKITDDIMFTMEMSLANSDLVALTSA